MSQPLVSGPCQLFITTGVSGAYEFLGYTESGVSARFMGSFKDVISDFGGTEVPVDVQWMGEQAYISATFNRYNESVMQKVVARRTTTDYNTVVTGATESNALGSLMVAQGLGFSLCLNAPYKALHFQTGVIVPGYTFGAAWLHDEWSVDVNVSVKAPRLVFRAIPLWNVATLSNVLYTNIVPTQCSDGSLLN